MLGLLFGILVGVPVTLCKEVARGMWEELRREALLTEDSVKQRLQQLQLMLQDGELTEEEYETMEEKLMERLRLLRGQAQTGGGKG